MKSVKKIYPEAILENYFFNGCWYYNIVIENELLGNSTQSEQKAWINAKRRIDKIIIVL